MPNLKNGSNAHLNKDLQDGLKWGLTPRYCKAFTLLEMAMVIAIMGILALVALAHYRASGHQMELSSDTEKLADIIKEAQSMALSGELVGGSRPGGYGVYLETDSYILFADDNENQSYDAGTDTIIQTFDFIEKVSIFSVSPACDTIICTPPKADISFFNCAGPASITITLTHSATDNTKQIIINRFGQIDIPL